MDKTGWLSLGREFHFAIGTRLARGQIKCLNYVPTDYHLGRASCRSQELGRHPGTIW